MMKFEAGGKRGVRELGSESPRFAAEARQRRRAAPSFSGRTVGWGA